jgi:hypothetical protein
MYHNGVMNEHRVLLHLEDRPRLMASSRQPCHCGNSEEQLQYTSAFFVHVLSDLKEAGPHGWASMNQLFTTKPFKNTIKHKTQNLNVSKERNDQHITFFAMRVQYARCEYPFSPPFTFRVTALQSSLSAKAFRLFFHQNHNDAFTFPGLFASQSG